MNGQSRSQYSLDMIFSTWTNERHSLVPLRYRRLEFVVYSNCWPGWMSNGQTERDMITRSIGNIEIQIVLLQ